MIFLNYIKLYDRRFYPFREISYLPVRLLKNIKNESLIHQMKK